MEAFIRGIPKAELHLHIEGTLEPEMVFALARKHGVKLKYPSVEALRNAYDFHNLQSFLDIYYEGANVLRDEDDFHAMTAAYIARAHDQGVVHVEIFFDPQTHTERGIAFETALNGIRRALDEAGTKLGITSRLIMCFLRHLSAEAALQTLKQALPHRDAILRKQAIRPRSSPGCSGARAKPVFSRWPMPEKRARRNTSTRLSTISRCRASITACAAIATRPCAAGSPPSAYR